MGENNSGVIRITPNKGTVIKELAIMTVMGALIILGVAVPAISYLAFLFCAAVIVVSDLQTGFCYMFFLMPFATVFKFSVGSSSNFTYLQILIVAKAVYTYFTGINRNFLIAVLLFAVYVILGSKMNVLTAIKQIMIPMTIFCFFKAYKADEKPLLRFFIFGLLLSSTVSLFIGTIPNLEKYVIASKAFELEDVSRASGLYTDPNYYSLALLISIMGLFCMLASKRGKIGVLIPVVLMVLFGSRTVSKSFLLVLAATIVIFVICLYMQKRFFMAVVFTAVAAIFFAAVLSGKVEIFNNILARIEAGGDDAAVLTTGRSVLWDRYMDAVFENGIVSLLFGHGVGAGFVSNSAAHNTLLDFLYYYGAAGTVLFITVCAIACGRGQKRRFSIMNICPWIIFAVMSMSLSCVMFFDFSFMIIMAVVFFRIDYRTANQDRFLKSAPKAIQI